MDARYASRKFLLAASAFAGGVAFFSLGMLTADQWMSHTAWVIGLYVAGNVGDSYVSPK